MLNILHLPHREDRLELLLHQLKEQNITEYTLWAGKLGTTSRDKRMNIVAGHKQIVQDAKDRNLPYVIIAEDDLTFTSKKAWDYYLKSMPSDFDIYFGMVYAKDKDLLEGNRLMKEASGFTLYTVHQRFYDQFLSCPPDRHIDRTITSWCLNYKFMLPEYFVCYQNDSQSDNTMGKPNLPMFLEGRKLFTS